MITPAEIRLKAQRHYRPFLQAWLQGESYFPLRFPIGKLPNDFSQLRAALEQHQAAAKVYGYLLETQQQQIRSLGMQTLPKAVVLKTAEDFLHLIAHEEEFRDFRQDVLLIREQLRQLEAWMLRFPQKVSEQHGCWPELLLVCRYLLDHPQPKLYVRELPIRVHTKFVEEHTGILRELLDELLPVETIVSEALTFQQRFGLREGEPKIQVRFLDDQLNQRYGLPLNELSTPCSQFAQLDLRGQRCIITENKMTFLTLPSLSETFAILGGGFGVGILAAIPWLSACPIIYWGDLDAQGFQILSQLRSLFPHVLSLMMDEQTLQAFSSFHVQGTPCTVRQLPHLTPEEHTIFLHLSAQTIRLEQERISHIYALECIKQCLSNETASNSLPRYIQQ